MTVLELVSSITSVDLELSYSSNSFDSKLSVQTPDYDLYKESLRSLKVEPADCCFLKVLRTQLWLVRLKLCKRFF